MRAEEADLGAALSGPGTLWNSGGCLYDSEDRHLRPFSPPLGEEESAAGTPQALRGSVSSWGGLGALSGLLLSGGCRACRRGSEAKLRGLGLPPSPM